VIAGPCLAVGVACGSFGSGSPPDPPLLDAASEADTTKDGAPSQVEAATDAGTNGPCAIGDPFGPATAIGGLGAYSVEAVRFGANRNVVYLSLCPADGGKPGCDLYQGAITAPDTYGSLTLIGVSAPNVYDSYPTVTGDAKWLFFGSSRAASAGAVNIHRASAPGGVFGDVQPQPLNFPGSELQSTYEPYLLGDGRTFYFAGTVQVAPAKWDIYRTEGNVPDFAKETVPVVGINTTFDDVAPVPTEDELEMFFASSRAGGSLDLWRAARTSVTQPFGNAERLADLSGAQNEFPTSISPDRCELYYIRKTGSGAGVGTAYVARRQKR
jgi:hypothetical protein